MSDMPNTAAELDAWAKTVNLTTQAKGTLGLLRSNLKQLAGIPDAEQFRGARLSMRESCQRQWREIEAAATPKDNR